MLDGPPTYWNSSVVERIQRDAGVDREAAGALWAEMLLFLDMVAVSKEFVSPPPAVDVAWHAFLLHTRDYEAYCRERYGRIIHHQPTGAPDPQAYRRAYEARSAANAPVDQAIWPVPVAISTQGDDHPDHGGGDDFGSPTGAIPGGDFQGQPGSDFAGDGEVGGGDFGGSDSGSSGGSSGDSGGSSCGGSSCGGGSS